MSEQEQLESAAEDARTQLVGMALALAEAGREHSHTWDAFLAAAHDYERKREAAWPSSKS